MKKPNIRNYTSEVSADVSVTNIEKKLVQHGATRIMKEYDGFGNVSSLSFQKALNGQTLSFKLPANVDAVHKIFLKAKSPTTDVQKKNLFDQAKRTAWKNVYDLVDIQLTMIEMQQMEFVEVFLSQLQTGQETVYSKLKKSDFKALGPGQ